MPSLPLDNQSLPESFVQDKDDRPQVPHDAFSDDVQVVSLAGTDDAGEGRKEGRKKIVEACEKWGMFQVVEHGVVRGLMDEIVRLSKEFFALPAQVVAISGHRKRGYIVSSTHQSRPGTTNSGRNPKWVAKGYGGLRRKLMGLSYKLLELPSEAMNLKKEEIAKACLAIDRKVIVNFYPSAPSQTSPSAYHGTPIPAPSPSSSSTRLAACR